MIARLSAALLLAAAILLIGATLAAARAGDYLLAVALPFLPFALMGLSFALEAVLLKRSRSGDPTPEPSWPLLTRALLGEARAAVPRFFWHQAWAWSSESQNIDALRHRGRTGLILVHGYFCNHGFWWNWKTRLARDDQPFLAVTLEPAFGDIGHTANIIEAAVQRVHELTGRPVVIVAHSMGGLAVRNWWAQHPASGSERVREVITIGSPHRGTELAFLAHTTNGRQMKVGGPWLEDLSRREPTDRAQRFTCFYGHCDNIVFPPARAQLPGADNRHLPGVAHVAMADHPQVLAAVLDALQLDQAPAPAPVTANRPGKDQNPTVPNTRSDGRPSPASISASDETSR